MKEGKELLLQERYAEARDKYAQACAVVHTDTCLRALAISELMSGRAVEAYRDFKEIDPKSLEGLDPSARAHTQDLMTKAYAQTGHIKVKTAVGARVWLDAQDAGVAPLQRGELTVTPGDHEVIAELGAKRATAHVSAAGGKEVEVALDVGQPEGAAPAPAVTTTSGSPASPPPDTGTQPAGGPGFWTTKHVTVIALAGGAVAAGVLGVVFAVGAGNAQNQIDSDHALIQQGGGNPDTFCATNPAKPPCPDLSSAASSHKTDAALETGFFIGAGALAVGAIAAWILWPEPPSSSTSTTAASWHPVPITLRGGGGVGLVGSF